MWTSWLKRTIQTSHHINAPQVRGRTEQVVLGNGDGVVVVFVVGVVMVVVVGVVVVEVVVVGVILVVVVVVGGCGCGCGCVTYNYWHCWLFEALAFSVNKQCSFGPAI